MSLLTDSMDECVLLNKVSVPDGYGGKIDTWAVSEVKFLSAITFNTSMEARVAESQGVHSLYTVTTGREFTLEYHDVFMRHRDGKIFRVTSDGDDSYTPAVASLNMRQVTAEEWSLPNE